MSARVNQGRITAASCRYFLAWKHPENRLHEQLSAFSAGESFIGTSIAFLPDEVLIRAVLQTGELELCF
jgi:hypothetical protein